jgi:hypothetical protein
VPPTVRPSARAYDVRLAGEASEGELEAALGGVSRVRHETRTVVSGRCTDQSALYRLLRLARSYGLEVLEFRVVSRTGQLSPPEDRT